MNDNPMLCITHYIDGIDACTVRAIHFAACERPDTCHGCVPREAQHGYLCQPCWGRLERSSSDWAVFRRTFAGEVRAVQPEPGNVTSKPSSTVPLSPLQLAMDAIVRYSKSRPGALRLWPTTPEGAEDAVRFTRDVERAVRAFPTKEQPSKIPTTRCAQCGRRTLVYEPAASEGADATVQCLNIECRHTMDHSSFERIALIEAQCCRRCRSDDGCRNTACACHTFSPVPEWERTNKPGEEQPYDPNRPSHSDLDALAALTMAELRTMVTIEDVPRLNRLRKGELIDAIRTVRT